MKSNQKTKKRSNVSSEHVFRVAPGSIAAARLIIQQYFNPKIYTLMLVVLFLLFCLFLASLTAYFLGKTNLLELNVILIIKIMASLVASILGILGILYRSRSGESEVSLPAKFAIAGILISTIIGVSILVIEKQSDLIEQERLRARELLRVAASQQDPLIAALVIAELKGLPEPEGGRKELQRLAKRPIPITRFNLEKYTCPFALNRDLTRLVVRRRERGALLLNATGMTLAVLDEPGVRYAVQSAEFNFDGSRLKMKSWHISSRGELIGVSVSLWDGWTGEKIARVDHAQYGVFRSEREWLVTYEYETGSLVARNSKTAEFVRVLAIPEKDILDSIITETGEVYTATTDGRVARWGGDPNEEISHFQVGTLMSDAFFTPDARHVVTVTNSSYAELWDVRSGQLVHEFFGRGNTIAYLSISPDGSRIVTVSNHGIAILWNLTAGKKIATLAKADVKLAPPISSDGRLIATPERLMDKFGNTSGGIVVLWDAENGEKQASLVGHRTKICAIAFSDDNNRIVTADIDGEVRVWPTRYRAPVESEWDNLIQHIRSSTTTCLRVPARKILLGETEAIAIKIHESCEQRVARFFSH